MRTVKLQILGRLANHFLSWLGSAKSAFVTMLGPRHRFLCRSISCLTCCSVSVRYESLPGGSGGVLLALVIVFTDRFFGATSAGLADTTLDFRWDCRGFPARFAFRALLATTRRSVRRNCRFPADFASLCGGATTDFSSGTLSTDVAEVRLCTRTGSDPVTRGIGFQPVVTLGFVQSPLDSEGPLANTSLTNGRFADEVSHDDLSDGTPVSPLALSRLCTNNGV